MYLKPSPTTKLTYFMGFHIIYKVIMNFSVCDDCGRSFLVNKNSQYKTVVFCQVIRKKKGTCTFVTPKLLF